MRLYRWLVRLYPVRFREEYEAELLAEYRAERAEARSLWQLWARLLWDLALTLPARLAGEVGEDLRGGWRAWRKRPLAGLAALGALAVGCGAATGLFSVADRLIWRSLPFREPERLAALHHQPGTLALAESRGVFAEWLEKSAYLEQAVLYTSGTMNVSGGAEAARVRVCESSANLFGVLGVEPVWGRGFLPGEDEPGRNGVALISHGFWVEAFGGERGVLGRVIRIGGAPFRVVGVAPPGLRFPQQAQVWVPTVFDFERIPKDGVMFWELIGRLKPGLGWEAARAAHEAEVRRVAPKRLALVGENRPALVELQRELAGRARQSSLVLLEAVGCLLLIACANVGGLLASRALERRRELVVRAALGATRGRICQQLVVEALALTAAAGLLGLGVAAGVVRLCGRLAPELGPALLDGRAALFATLAALLTGLLAGVAPAWYASRLETNGEALRLSGSQRLLRGGQRWALAGQVALSLVLLSGALSLGRSLVGLLHEENGYQTRGLFTARVALTGSAADGAVRRRAYYRQALAQLRELAGVESVAGASLLPLSRDPVGMAAWKREDGTATPALLSAWVTDGYFETLGIGLLAGRGLEERDRAGQEPVAVVSEEVALGYGGARAALGRRLTSGKQQVTIVGVARAVRHFGPGGGRLAQIYRPLEQGDSATLTFVLKSRRQAAELAALVRSELGRVDGAVPVYGTQSLESYLDERLEQPRLYVGLISAFGGFALTLALVGLGAGVRQSVARRRPEFGLRLALGARPAGLLALLLRQNGGPLLAALTAGGAAAWGLGPAAAHLMAQARPVSAGECVAAALAVGLAAAATIAVSAAGLRRLDPARVLRSE